MNVNHLILDYVAICERRGELLDFPEFVELWKVAAEVAEETAPERPGDGACLDSARPELTDRSRRLGRQTSHLHRPRRVRFIVETEFLPELDELLDDAIDRC